MSESEILELFEKIVKDSPTYNKEVDGEEPPEEVKQIILIFAEAIRRKTLEEAKQICIAVKVSDESESTNEGDEAYNLAISHCCGELSIAQEGVTK